MSMIGNCLKLSEAQLAAVIEDPEEAIALAYPEDDRHPGALDLDKSWHLIHFLLNGEAWGGEPPLGNVILGGTELADTDAGYGPFRYLLASEVRESSLALAKVSADDVWSGFDSQRVKDADIYPEPWVGDETERTYIKHHYEALREYFAQAAEQGAAMLLYIS
ncbi:YfbM family protein [Polaromonas sp. LjRoot131]|uniref:YfbM family protein n=1 Tax=Polaromonas sp. LjRoot131 TaxID=3342262 RepID=UPI003ECE8A58